MAELSSGPSIASCGKSCSSLFPQLVVSLDESSLQGQLSSASVKEESKRFELWARNIAALQDAHLPSSLEHRLRDDASARGIVKKAMLYLEESLHMALSIASGERENEVWDLLSPDEQPADTSVDLYSGSSELRELGLAIQEGITNLFRLSMIIRKKPEKDEYLKASLTYTIDPTADIIHVGDKYPPAKKGDKWLMERLGIAITRRRQYLLYRKEHQEKMEQVHTLKKDAGGKTVWSGEKASTYHPNEALEDSRPADLNIWGFVSSAPTEYADSSKGKDGASDLLRTPLLPKDSVGVRAEYNQHFECPYCWRPQKVGDKNEWKKHIFGDLRPYVCTFESCGLNMFESQNQWFEHEMRFHRKQWTCQYCKETTAQSRPELEKHMTLIHADRIQESHLDGLLDACRVSRVDATECPLCTEYGNKFQRINQSKKCDVSLKQFQEHLGRHMEQLALSALPQEEVDDADSFDTKATSFDQTVLANEEAVPGEDEASGVGEVQGTDRLNDTSPNFLFGGDPSLDPELARAWRETLEEQQSRRAEEDERQQSQNINLPQGDMGDKEPQVMEEPPDTIVEDDVLLLTDQDQGLSISANFPAYSIGDGKLRVRDIRERAAMWRAKRGGLIKLSYKGQQLKDDALPAKDYGIKNKSKILVAIGYNIFDNSSSSDGFEGQEGDGARQRDEVVEERLPSTEPNADPGPVIDDDIEWGPFGFKENNKKMAGTDESLRPELVTKLKRVEEGNGSDFAKLGEKWRDGKEVFLHEVEEGEATQPSANDDAQQLQSKADNIPEPAADDKWGLGRTSSKNKQNGKNVPLETPTEASPSHIEVGPYPEPTVSPSPLDNYDWRKIRLSKDVKSYTTARHQLDDISTSLQKKFVPLCKNFTETPLPDLEHRKLTYGVLRASIHEMLLKLETIETDDDPEARQLRKWLISRTQVMLRDLDSTMA